MEGAPEGGQLKGSARTTLTSGARDTESPTIDGAGKVTGGTGRHDAKGNLVISGGGNPDGTLTLRIDGVLELALH